MYRADGDKLTIDLAAPWGLRSSGSTRAGRVTLRLPPGTLYESIYAADGNPLAGPCTVYRLHPQAAFRLETLADTRYAGMGRPTILPVPWAMVVRGAGAAPPPRKSLARTKR